MEIINLSNNIIELLEFANKQGFECYTEKAIEEEEKFITVYITNNTNTKYIGVVATYLNNTYVLESYICLNNSYPFITMGIENLNLDQVKKVILTELA